MAEAGSFHMDPEDLVLRYLEDPKPDLKDLILVQYSGLVERVARRFAGIEPVEDLVQVGYIGLLNALSKFDAEAGVRFTTYATYLVAGEIKHYLRDRAQTIRHPAWLQELRHKVNRVAGVLQHRLGREPSEKEIAEELEVSEQAVRDVFQTAEMLRITSLDATPSDEDSDSDIDRLDAAEFCPQQLGFEDRMLLENAMRQLRDLERDVLTLFHFEAMNQTEIAAKLGISCNYVSHILRQSLAKLRKILVDEQERDDVLRRQTAQIDYEVMDRSTGAYTESYFRSRLEEEIHRATCENGAVAVAIIEVTGLDSLRAFYGDQSAQDFLADAAEFFKANVRRLDVVCRYGRDGFGIILPATGANVAIVRQRLITKVNQWIAQSFSQASNLRVRIGHAAFPEDGRSGQDLIRAAQAENTPGAALKAA